jgi:aspartyl-tRNA(Asn)/glutamyl-tRNA(Gln) amidotransferase subunit C
VATSAGDVKLTTEQARWLARLARLELSPRELETLTGQVGQILAYVAQLQQVNTEGVEPLAHALDVSNVFRADEPAPSLSPAEALANAPRRQDDFFSVPAVLD